MAVITPVDLIVLAIGVAVLAAWLALFFRGRKNDWMFEQLNDKDYPVKELYFIGYEIEELLKMQS